MKYTIKQIAEKNNLSQKIIRMHIASGSLIAKKEGSSYKIEEEDLLNWEANGYNNPDYFKHIVNLEENNYLGEKDNVSTIDISNKFKNFDGWKNTKDRNNYNFIDLFSGAGGLGCGLTMAGFSPVASVEIMNEAVETYKHNFSKIKNFDSNIETRDIRSEDVKNELYNSVANKHIHLISGGFPCQGFSMSGNRVYEDPRNSLYKEMLEIVNHIRPDFIIMENVIGLRSMLKGKVEEKIINDYREIGYNVDVTVLNSAYFNVPQLRKRVIFIGNRMNVQNLYPEHICDDKNFKTVKDAISKYENMDENISINHIITKHKPATIEKIKKVEVGHSLYSNYTESWFKSPWDKPSCTIKENHGGCNLHPHLPRVLTPREMAALQSFPDDFIFKGSKNMQLVQIGNAVPPLLGKAIGLAVSHSLDLIYKNDANN